MLSTSWLTTPDETLIFVVGSKTSIRTSVGYGNGHVHCCCAQSSAQILLEPGYVLEEHCSHRGNELRESGRQFYDVRYRKQFDDLFGSISSWFMAMGEDPVSRLIRKTQWRYLIINSSINNLGKIGLGSPRIFYLTARAVSSSSPSCGTIFVKSSCRSLPSRWVWYASSIPLFTISLQVGYIPIPRIEYTDDNLDLVVENLALQGRNLLPNIISLEANNYIKFSPYDAITGDNRHRITLHLEQMQADLRDVAFYYRLKGGLKMTDSGLADVLLGGRGLSVSVFQTSIASEFTPCDSSQTSFSAPPLATSLLFSKWIRSMSKLIRWSFQSEMRSTVFCTRRCDPWLRA